LEGEVLIPEHVFRDALVGRRCPVGRLRGQSAWQFS
jgi:hypothetical protein